MMNYFINSSQVGAKYVMVITVLIACIIVKSIIKIREPYLRKNRFAPNDVKNSDEGLQAKSCM